MDGNVTLDEMADHERCSPTRALPISVDMENGYGASRRTAARAITRPGSGAVGGSIEDWDPDDERIYEIDEAAEGVQAAAEAAAKPRLPVHAHRPRREPHPREPDLDDTIARLQAA